MLVLSLAAYPACRLISRADIAAGRSAFIWATGMIVALGSVATAVALWQQWDDQHGKPYVFGFDAAGTYFLGSLCFLIIALVTSGGLTLRRTAVVSALIFLPTAIFAASLVRFTFLALAGDPVSGAVLSEARQRKHVVIIAFVHPRRHRGRVAGPVRSRRGCSRTMRWNDRPARSGWRGRRAAIYGESPKFHRHQKSAGRRMPLFLIPRSGWIGTGLDSFMKFSCIKLTEVHNSVLQATVEFGWLGGSLLACPYCRRRRFARFRWRGTTMRARFALCGLAFVVLLSLAHGRVSRDGVLFALLGCAVGLKETSRAPRRRDQRWLPSICPKLTRTTTPPAGISAVVHSAVRSRFWLLCVDIYPVLVAASIPWSTSGVAIFMAIWFIVLIPTIEPAPFLEVTEGACLLAAPGVRRARCWSGRCGRMDHGPARLHGINPVTKLLAIPFLIYHFERSRRGLWVLVAFLASCALLMGLSWIVLFAPEWKIAATETPGVPLKNSINQSQEFALCIFALAPLVLEFFKQRRLALAAVCAALMLAFFANMMFVVLARTALLYMLVLTILFAVRHLDVAPCGCCSPRRPRPPSWSGLPHPICGSVSNALRSNTGNIPRHFVRPRPASGWSTGAIDPIFWRSSLVRPRHRVDQAAVRPGGGRQDRRLGAFDQQSAQSDPLCRRAVGRARMHRALCDVVLSSPAVSRQAASRRGSG